MKKKRKEVDSKESEFVVRNRVVPPEKIRRYMERRDTPAHAPLSQFSPTGEVFQLLS